MNSPNLSLADSTQMSVSMCIQWSFWSVQSPFWLEYNVWLWTGYYFEPGKCFDKATKNNLGYTFWQCCCLKKRKATRGSKMNNSLWDLHWENKHSSKHKEFFFYFIVRLKIMSFQLLPLLDMAKSDTWRLCMLNNVTYLLPEDGGNSSSLGRSFGSFMTPCLQW